LTGWQAHGARCAAAPQPRAVDARTWLREVDSGDREPWHPRPAECDSLSGKCWRWPAFLRQWTKFENLAPDYQVPGEYW